MNSLVILFLLLACVNSGGFYYAGASVGYPMFSCSVCNTCRCGYQCSNHYSRPAEPMLMEKAEPMLMEKAEPMPMEKAEPMPVEKAEPMPKVSLPNVDNLPGDLIHISREDLREIIDKIKQYLLSAGINYSRYYNISHEQNDKQNQRRD